MCYLTYTSTIILFCCQNVNNKYYSFSLKLSGLQHSIAFALLFNRRESQADVLLFLCDPLPWLEAFKWIIKSY